MMWYMSGMSLFLQNQLSRAEDHKSLHIKVFNLSFEMIKKYV